MKRVAIALALCFVAGAARASPVPYVGGTGPPNVLPANPQAVWSEPPDLNGLIGSSEQILAFGLESELANDFVGEGSIGLATFWGGYYNNSTPCQSGITTPGFNLKFYQDGGCVPGTLDAYIVATDFVEASVGCQQGVFPMFRWDVYTSVSNVSGNLYWFGAQLRDHVFPPQGGRLAAGQVTGCDTVFQSAYFGYPDWTPAIDVFGVAFDCSQELQGYIVPPPPGGACCIGSECRMVDDAAECNGLGGQYQGDYSSCDPVNPCVPVPSKSTSWGKIKASYR